MASDWDDFRRGVGEGGHGLTDVDICDIANDEISRLQADLARVTAQRERLRRSLDLARMDRDRERARAEKAGARGAELRDKLEKCFRAFEDYAQARCDLADAKANGLAERARAEKAEARLAAVIEECEDIIHADEHADQTGMSVRATADSHGQRKAAERIRVAALDGEGASDGE